MTEDQTSEDAAYWQEQESNSSSGSLLPAAAPGGGSLLVLILILALAKCDPGYCDATYKIARSYIDPTGTVSAYPSYSQMIRISKSDGATNVVTGCLEDGNLLALFMELKPYHRLLSNDFTIDRKQYHFSSKYTNQTLVGAEISPDITCKGAVVKAPEYQYKHEGEYKSCPRKRFNITPVKARFRKSGIEPLVVSNNVSNIDSLTSTFPRVGNGRPWNGIALLDLNSTHWSELEWKETTSRLPVGNYGRDNLIDHPGRITVAEAVSPFSVYRTKLSIESKQCLKEKLSLPECKDSIYVVSASNHDLNEQRIWSTRARERDWLNYLPKVPSRLCFDSLSFMIYLSVNKWDRWTPYSNNYHPFASYEMRSSPVPGSPYPWIGHQAMYNENGRLIRPGEGLPIVSSGSADRVRPGRLSWRGHISHDVKPFIRAAWLDGNYTFPTSAYLGLKRPLTLEGKHFKDYVYHRPSITPNGVDPINCSTFE